MLARMEKNGESIEQQLSNNMVFTSNDRDNIDDTTVSLHQCFHAYLYYAHI